ncbi:MAG: hypothetical protein PVH87_09665 [Desulfobacteraceae bacterium]|jgi:hypothetical protein
MNRIIDNWETKENTDIILSVRKAQIQQLYRQTWGGLTGLFLVMISNCVIFWQVIPHRDLLLWGSGLMLLIIARGLLTVAFQKKEPSGYNIYRWAKLHVTTTAATALMWGIPSILLWPNNSPLHQMVWPLTIAAMNASAVAMYFTWKPSYIAYLILSAVPIALRLLLEGGLLYTVLGLLGILFIFILAQTGKVMHAASLRAYIVSIRNEALCSFLAREKAKTEELNKQLEKEIEERKGSQKELLDRNQELKQLNTQLSATKKDIENANKELKRALDNVKQLSGMLPICSSCKKIRNDKGYWEQIETYIHVHSEAQFSHGICPECAEKLYPMLLKET